MSAEVVSGGGIKHASDHGVLKSKDGVYFVRKKVPAKLEEAVSTVLGVSRPRVSWLKRSLRTKDPREANIRAKPVLMEFDRVLAKAVSVERDVPQRTHLSEREIERMADYQFASMLEEDEEVRRDGTGSEELFQAITRQLREAGITFSNQFAASGKPRFGLSDREMLKIKESVEGPLAWAREALARRDISFVQEELAELLNAFRVNLDRDTKAYRQLGMEVLRSYVRAIQAIERRNQGEAIETPRIIEPQHNVAMGSTLSAALDGWKKTKQPARSIARMRLDEEEPQREPWEAAELQLLSSPVFSEGERPNGGRGEAAYWFPLLALFTGDRQGELAPLVVGDVTHDGAMGITCIAITEDAESGTRLKTASSRRVVPVHPELVKLGFLDLVEDRRSASGKSAPLFPLLKPGPRGGYAEGWSKWFGRYIRGIGIANPARVFHSFRHTFKDALRAAGVSEDVHDALTGHSGGGVGRAYGAKEMARRFGLAPLAEAVGKVEYRGLDLSHLYVHKS